VERHLRDIAAEPMITGEHQMRVLAAGGARHAERRRSRRRAVSQAAARRRHFAPRSCRRDRDSCSPKLRCSTSGSSTPGSAFTEDATYSVPATDAPDAEPDDTLFLIADDAERSLAGRAADGKTTWSENPHARTRRLLGNVRIRRTEGARAWVTANFAVYRMRSNQVATYVGRYEYVLERQRDGLRIQSRRAILDPKCATWQDQLHPSERAET
jgi:p-cumate 2,3-dioxygenase beta subunit